MDHIVAKVLMFLPTPFVIYVIWKDLAKNGISFNPFKPTFNVAQIVGALYGAYVIFILEVVMIR